GWEARRAGGGGGDGLVRAPPASLLTNWAGNVVYGAAQTATPGTVDEVRQIVVAATRAKAVGSGHSFRAIASTRGTLISMREIARIDSLAADGSVRVGAGRAA